MQRLRVNGGKALSGGVRLPKAKNSILPMMAAALLCEGESRLYCVPRIADVDTSIRLVKALGGCACLENGVLTVAAGRQMRAEVPPELSAAMRSSVYYLAPLLLRCGSVRLAFPGGCRLGERPIDLHLTGLEEMGATVCTDQDGVFCTAPNGLHGANICLSFPSVGATETLLMAACRAKGVTVLCGCAKEPEIVDLARYLTRCGARITGAGGCCITVQGVPALHGAAHTPIPDRIIAATVLCAAAACGGSVTLHQVCSAHLTAVVHLLECAGAAFDRPDACTLRMHANRPLTAVDAVTGVYPAFPTDAGPLLAAALLTMRGSGSVTETIFQNRFACADGFAALGGRVERKGRDLFVEGPAPLTGATLTAEDLRGGAALVVAALAAEGESHIGGTGYIDRGYEDIAALFSALGADLCWEKA